MILGHADLADLADFLRRTRIIGAARAETQARLMSLPSRDDNGRSQLHEYFVTQITLEIQIAFVTNSQKFLVILLRGMN